MHAHLPGRDMDFGEEYDIKQAPCRLLIMKKILTSIFTCSTSQNRIKDHSFLHSFAAFSYTPFTHTAKWQGAWIWDLGAGKQKTCWGRLLRECRNAQQHLGTLAEKEAANLPHVATGCHRIQHCCETFALILQSPSVVKW